MNEFIEKNNLNVKLECRPVLDFLESIENDKIHCSILEEQELDEIIAEDLYRVLKVGGILLIFVSTKTIHDVCNLMVETGFSIRDVIAWVNPSIQSTSFGMEHLIKKTSNLSTDEKKRIKEEMSGMRTMKLRNCFTPIIICQKPIPSTTTLIQNYVDNKCGLMNSTRTAGGNLSSNVITTDFVDGYDKAFLIPRPPFCSNEFHNQSIRLIYHLLNTFTHEDSTILDLVMGNGAILYASLLLRRHYYGNEVCRKKLLKIGFDVDKFCTTIGKGINEFNNKNQTQYSKLDFS